MQIFREISAEVLGYLEGYRQWAMSGELQASLERSVTQKKSSFVAEGNAEGPCSAEYLRAMDHAMHVGFPLEFYAMDINSQVLNLGLERVEPDRLREILRKGNELDDQLQTFLGAKACALKAYYPAKGHIGWHTNWNTPGYNIIFTYSATGKGYWRHVEPAPGALITPDPARIVHVPDVPGWHCKAGYFGAKSEPGSVVWHAAYTDEPRITVSYVVYDHAIWENMVKEVCRK
jgi:hypothetical protein